MNNVVCSNPVFWIFSLYYSFVSFSWDNNIALSYPNRVDDRAVGIAEFLCIKFGKGRTNHFSTVPISIFTNTSLLF